MREWYDCLKAVNELWPARDTHRYSYQKGPNVVQGKWVSAIRIGLDIAKQVSMLACCRVDIERLSG